MWCIKLLPLLLAHALTHVTQAVAALQEQLQLLPNLTLLRVHFSSFRGGPDLTVSLLQSLPPTLRYLEYKYDSWLPQHPAAAAAGAGQCSCPHAAGIVACWR